LPFGASLVAPALARAVTHARLAILHGSRR
jgi:hypothetical protein